MTVPLHSLVKYQLSQIVNTAATTSQTDRSDLGLSPVKWSGCLLASRENPLSLTVKS